MKVSARNQLKGTVAEVRKGQTTGHVRINAGGTTLTASITNEAADELKLAKGMTVHAVIKASDVMVGIDEPPSLVAGVKSIEEVPAGIAQVERTRLVIFRYIHLDIS
jgi:molybdopterin-binding protein